MYRKGGFNIHNKINMKVTSFEISKKLAEIGFNPEEDDSTGHCFWCRMPSSAVELFDYSGINNFTRGFEELCRAYDLETILDALPMEIENKYNPIENWQFDMTKEFIGYFYYYSCQSDVDKDTLFSTIKLHAEPLADTAARLLIKLHWAGLVKFKEE